jgi:hypothetical protein
LHGEQCYPVATCEGEDCELGETGDFGLIAPEDVYERQFGTLEEVWQRRSAEIKKTPIFKLADDLVPDLPAGTKPKMGFHFKIGPSVDLGHFDMSPPDWFWTVVHTLVVMFAVFGAYSIIFR